MSIPSSPLVSIIVPTYNSSQFLEACLKSIKSQIHQHIELIVVDNNSTDSTREIARRFTSKVFTKGPERSSQRNFGAKQSQGEYLLFIDSDMELSKNIVKGCVEKIGQNNATKGIIIPEESFGKGLWAQCKKLERSFYVGVDWIEAARFFERSTFDRVGGYNEKLISGEDWDLSQKVERLGTVARITDFIYHNEGSPSLFSILKKKFYYAQHIHKYNGKKQKSVLARYKLFFSQPSKLLRNPLLYICMLFMKTLEFFFGGVGYFIHK